MDNQHDNTASLIKPCFMPGSRQTTSAAPVIHLAVSGLIFVASLVYFAAPLGVRPLHTRGEAREASVVQAMVYQDNYILPLRNGATIPSKPPLFHWLAVLSTKAFHRVFARPLLDEFSIRFPSACCAALALAVLFLFITNIANYQTALLTILILATTFEWARSATHARVDMCFSICLMIALLTLYQNINRWKAGESYSVPLLAISSLSYSFAILSKGPAALILVGVIPLLYLVTVADVPLVRFISKFPFTPYLIALFLALIPSALWYTLAYLQHGSDFLHVQFVSENLSRILDIDGEVPGHKKPIYFVFVYLFVGFLPWSLLVPFLFTWLWRNRDRLVLQEKNAILYALIWTSVFIAVVAFSGSKRVVYLLPAYPPLAYLFALALVEAWETGSLKNGYNKAGKITAAIFSVVFLCLFAVGAGIFNFSELASTEYSIFAHMNWASKAQTEQMLALFDSNRLLYAILFLLLALVALSVVTCLKRQTKILIASLTCFSIVATVTLNFLLLSAYAEFSSPRAFMAEVVKIVPPGEPFFQFQDELYAAQFYAARHIPVIQLVDADFLKMGYAYLLLKARDLEKVKQVFRKASVIIESANLAAYGTNRLMLVKIEPE